MKTEFHKDLGIAQEVIDKIMAENGKDVEAVRSQVETLKTQLGEVNTQMEAFKGVDVNALNEKVAALQKDIADKQKEFQAKLADRDFQAALNESVLAAKGKNTKAVMALLDLDTLKASKNQKEDIAAAIAALKTSDAYLFDGEQQKTGEQGTPARVSSGGSHEEGGTSGGTKGASNMNAFMNAAIRGESKGD